MAKKTKPHAALCHGVKVPHSPFLNETRIRRMGEGKYEGEEIRGALEVIRPGDRVLEMGSGLGVVGAVIAKNAKPEAVLSFEANPNLIPHINALYELNGLQDRIEVRHQVVMAAPEPPDHVTFHLRTSFLGSSLIDQDKRRTTGVDVPTKSYDDVVDAFRPDVLVMDIEGGEQDFLRHADLRGIRAIIIEFHPDVYGKPGAHDCKTILKKAGFEKRKDVSTRFVWAATRPDWQAHGDASWPRPDFGWSHATQTLTKAIIKPTEGDSLIGPAGVQAAGGADVPVAAHWRNTRRITMPFDTPPAPRKPLAGRWLWGGVLYWNFAHFVAESLGRLWALDGAPPVDGIVFVPRRSGDRTALLSFQTGVFEALGIDLPIVVADEPMDVEELVVPGQGFGLGPIVKGTPAFRTFIHTRFGEGIAPDGPERLYISRSQLSVNRGGLLGESILEQHLQDEGYEVFCPEKHSIATQIARYKAAKQIVSCDGSALHLYALCGRSDQEVAMIIRRKSAATTLIERHIAHFTGRAPLSIDCLRAEWQQPGTRRARLVVGEPDMPALQNALQAGGFVSGGPAWPALTPDFIREALGPRFQVAA
ncbi:FkbM family methyltransferase [uncultured Tateyamaria sp.]|uniref:FkbM family methyltransferase n=1 Tax=Tateyamaria sp. 1078 TaxID=3417464 RepID=UPI0026370331|nr:FkbM family methyltransferase [uncultured Tateyamaria sp.]